MTAVTDAALARLSASIQNSSSMKLSLAGKAVPCTRNTSRPRTFSRTRTNRLPSEKRSVSDWPSSHPRYSAIECPRRRLAEPAKSRNSSSTAATLRTYGDPELSIARGRTVLPPGAAVDQLAQDVGVPRVARRLLQQVAQDPTQVAGAGRARVLARVVQLGPGDDGADPRPRVPVGGDRRVERVACDLDGVAGEGDVEAGEAPLHPDRLGEAQVLHQPQQRGPAGHRRAPGVLVAHAVHLAHHGVPLELEQREQRLPLAVQPTGRLLVGHGRSVRPTRRHGTVTL